MGESCRVRYIGGVWMRILLGQVDGGVEGAESREDPMEDEGCYVRSFGRGQLMITWLDIRYG